jgi:hypothetical protein
MTRSGFAYVVRKHTATARAQCPVLRDKRISPHTLRHTCALNILQATGDIRKVSLWLGHAQQSTTEIYLQVDPTQKIATLESPCPFDFARGASSPRTASSRRSCPARHRRPLLQANVRARYYAESTPQLAQEKTLHAMADSA